MPPCCGCLYLDSSGGGNRPNFNLSGLKLSECGKVRPRRSTYTRWQESMFSWRTRKTRASEGHNYVECLHDPKFTCIVWACNFAQLFSPLLIRTDFVFCPRLRQWRRYDCYVYKGTNKTCQLHFLKRVPLGGQGVGKRVGKVMREVKVVSCQVQRSHALSVVPSAKIRVRIWARRELSTMVNNHKIRTKSPSIDY